MSKELEILISTLTAEGSPGSEPSPERDQALKSLQSFLTPNEPFPLRDVASAVVRRSEDRSYNYLQVGDLRVGLAPQPTAIETKVQWADAEWLVLHLLRLGFDLGSKK